MIPLIHNLEGKRVTICGGGEVGLRKAKFFGREAGVTVLSRSFHDEFDETDACCVELDLDAAPDRELAALLAGSFLVVAATPDQDLNDRIGRIARSVGALFNNASGKEGDIFLPSVLYGERYLIAISTAGGAPAVSRYLRLVLEDRCANLDQMIRLQEQTRAYLKDYEPSGTRRAAVLECIIQDDEVWTALGDGFQAAAEIVARKYLT